MQNLSVVRWAKTGNRGVVSRRHYEDVVIPQEMRTDLHKKEVNAKQHVMVAATFCYKESLSALVKQTCTCCVTFELITTEM